jgi:ATP-dependent Clp protease protease subunit
MMLKNKLGFEVKNLNEEAGTAELYVYGEIVSEKWWDDGSVSPEEIKNALDPVMSIKHLDMYINSPGGSVFAGVAMYSILNRSEAHIVAHVDGIAASAATYLVMAADEIKMPENTMLMIHKPMSWGGGNADDFRSQADALDKIEETVVSMYDARFENLDADKIKEMMRAETYMTAAEAVEHGLIQSVGELKTFETTKAENKLTINGVEFSSENIKNLPENFSGENVKEEPVKGDEETADYSYFENSIKQVEATL